MGAALKQIDQEDYPEAIGEEKEATSRYGFTTVIMNKHTGEIIKTIKYQQVVLTIEEYEKMEENIYI